MKKTFILIFTLLSLTAFAQKEPRPQVDSERMKAAKVAFLTEKLNLDTETAQVFWPLYNEFEADKDRLNKKFYTQMKDLGIESPRRAMETISDDQAEAMVELMFEKRAEDLKLEMDYIEKVAKVLSPKQTLMVSQFDAEFRRTLMRRFSEENRSRGNRPDKGN